MCLGREINESRGQSWEQSDKEALRRDLPGGLAAEAPRTHSRGRGFWPCLQKWDPARSTAQAKKLKNEVGQMLYLRAVTIKIKGRHWGDEYFEDAVSTEEF